MRPKIALVLGAEGFMGAHLIEALLMRGWEVRGIDRPASKDISPLLGSIDAGSCHIEYRDIMDLSETATVFADVDHVFYAAMAGNHIESVKKPETIFDLNLLPLIRTLECVRYKKSIYFHHLSSAAVYGSAKGCIDEGCITAPNTPYGLNKLFEEMAVQYWNEHYGVSSNIYRVFSCYGPWQSSGGVFGKFVNAKMSGDEVTLNNQGCSKRDFTYVKDIVLALILGADKQVVSSIYNLGAGKMHSLMELAKELDLKAKSIGECEDDEVFANNTKAKVELDWNPNFDLSKGVGESVARMRQLANRQCELI